MKIKKEHFLNAINSVKDGASANPLVEQSEMFIFEPTRIATFNDELAVSFPFETGVKGAVSAKEFAQVVEKFPSDEIEVFGNENKIVLEGGKAEAEFVLADLVVPDFGIDDSAIWEKVPADFWDGIDSCIFSTGDRKKGALFNIYIESQIILSCDNYRATRFEMSGEINDGEPVLIPQVAAAGLLTHRPTEVLITPQWTHFRAPSGLAFSHRTVIDDYPPVKSMFDCEGVEIELPKDLPGAMDFSESTAATDKTKFKQIEVTIEKGKITCRGIGLAAKSSNSVDSNYTGNETIVFMAYPKMISKTIEKSDRAIISTEGKKKRVLFKLGKTEHVVLIK